LEKKVKGKRNCFGTRCWLLTLEILTTQEAEIRKIKVQNQPRLTVYETLSQKKSQKMAGGELMV
jgi:hypothetical protein